MSDDEGLPQKNREEIRLIQRDMEYITESFKQLKMIVQELTAAEKERAIIEEKRWERQARFEEQLRIVIKVGMPILMTVVLGVVGALINMVLKKL